MSPLAKRRMAVFRANRRAVWSLRTLILLSLIALASPIIANDRPIVACDQNRCWWPILFDYTEREIGGEFPTLADWRDPYVADMFRQRGGWLLWPPIPWSYDTVDWELPDSAPTPPDRRHWLGTDDRARDVLARVIHGIRISLFFGVVLTVISTVIGVAVGAIQGWYGGRVDLYGQRLIEIWNGLPVLYMLIILQSYFVPGLGTLLVVTALFSWTALVGVVRAEVLRVRNFEFVMAARALGASDLRVVVRHVVPNAMVATLTFLPFVTAGAITTLTSLDFLGFGLPPDWPSLGELLAQGKNNLQAPWLGITGFLVTGLLLSVLVFVGEGVRDALDPRRTA